MPSCRPWHVRRLAVLVALHADVTALQVVVDQPEGLHGRVGGRRSDEPEAVAPQRLRQCLGLGGDGRQVTEALRNRPPRRGGSKSHTIAARDPLRACTSSVARALAIAASIFPR